ncbi:hypothetical protein BC834DRAFT_815746 [Gloeopeniophorella convolvens]|nr:hypothetical protein BC834DRAFT_815746 [Gloeopeniophorella convolvens]
MKLARCTPPAPPPTRHVRLRAHPGPGGGHAVDRHPAAAAAPTTIPRPGPSAPPPAAPICPTWPSPLRRCLSEACVPPSRFQPLPFPSAQPSPLLSSAKAPAVRRACTSCHSGKTRCSEILPCQSCLKRGLGATCAYPDPEAPVDHSQQPTPGSSSLISFVPMSAEATCVAPGLPSFSAAPIPYMQPPSLTHQQYYEYNGSFTGASTSTFRPNKRPRPLTEEEAAAITRNFSRGDFYIGTSAPIRIDPRLPVRLTLGEGDHVHFTIGETLV